ncbi:MAG: glycosyl transferase family 2 [Planctomyces sp.]|nr:glycosyl transferase family 2 [Planctomyces sp.]
MEALAAGAGHERGPPKRLEARVRRAVHAPDPRWRAGGRRPRGGGHLRDPDARGGGVSAGTSAVQSRRTGDGVLGGTSGGTSGAVPGVSFVVPAHNEAAELPETLGAIHAAGRALGLAYEIVVADDDSDDGTGALALAHGARLVRHQRRQIAATRNLGASAAAGAWLVFVDADTRVSAGAVREALDALAAGAVGGGAPMRFDGWIPWYARALLPLFNGLFRLCRRTGGAFLFCTAEALRDAGGWDETLYASEELTLAAGLWRRGRFVVIRTPVTTSGRKLRTHSAREMFGLLARALWYRRAMLTDRAQLGHWYDARRPDPHRGGPG